MKSIVIIAVGLAFLGMATSTSFAKENDNPFGFFYHKDSDRYFFDGKRSFYIDPSYLDKNRLKAELSLDDGPFRPFGTFPQIQTEGRHKIKYRALDVTEQIIFLKEYVFYLDTSPPKTSPVYPKEVRTVDGALCVSDPNAIRLVSYDMLSGVGRIEISRDGSHYVAYDESKPLLEPGRHQIYYRAIDNVGNAEESKSFQYAFSQLPPKTDLSVKPQPIDKEDQRFLGLDATFDLKSTATAVPIKETVVRVDGDRFVYEKPFQVSSEGKHKLIYYSVDYAGNAEPERSFVFYTDAVSPKTSLTLTGKTVEYGQTQFVGKDFRMVLSASDDGSGVREILYRFNDEGEGYHRYSEALKPKKDGYQTVSYFSVDKVGNNESAQSISFVADVTPPDTNASTGFPLSEIEGNRFSLSPNVVMIQSKDNLSGVLETVVSVNDSPFEAYRGPIQLDKREVNKIVYKSIDRMGNEEPAKTLKVNMAHPGMNLKIMARGGAAGQEETTVTPPRKSKRGLTGKP